ncbi:MAG: hypothetical protein OXI27_02250 [Thaumarchaeota archaeon]|nr:hypothetical protein [Nitrososphaerota archaeon]
MVDDEPDSIKMEMANIKEYLRTEHDLELELYEYKEAQEMIDGMDRATDIAFIDKNLGSATGLDVIREIRNRDKLLDILAYSRASIDDKEMAEMSSYGLVEVAQEKEEIIDKLQTLIDKNLAKWEDMSYLRGVVISRLIDIEREIDDILMEELAPRDDREEKFRDYVLENSDISMFAKRKILSKIKNGEEVPLSLSKLDNLQESRNLLAHCKSTEGDPKTLTLMKMGQIRVIDKDEIRTIFRQAEEFSECLTAFKRARFSSRTTE